MNSTGNALIPSTTLVRSLVLNVCSPSGEDMMNPCIFILTVLFSLSFVSLQISAFPHREESPTRDDIAQTAGQPMDFYDDVQGHRLRRKLTLRVPCGSSVKMNLVSLSGRGRAARARELTSPSWASRRDDPCYRRGTCESAPWSNPVACPSTPAASHNLFPYCSTCSCSFHRRPLVTRWVQ